MSLSDLNAEDQALVARVLPRNKSLTHYMDFRCGGDDLADLLAAARAEGVAALQQAGEQIAENANCYQQAGERVEACIEDVKSGLCCPRPQGCEQNDSEYCLVRQAFARAGLIADPDASPLPQQTALVEGVEKIITQHEPSACGEGTLPSPSEAPRSDGGEG